MVGIEDEVIVGLVVDFGIYRRHSVSFPQPCLHFDERKESF